MRALKISYLAKVQALVEKTEGAYSFDRYKNWGATIGLLLNAGYDEREVEAIVMSKWARWAADSASNQGEKYGHIKGKHLLNFVVKQGDAEVKKLTEEHFS